MRIPGKLPLTRPQYRAAAQEIITAGWNVRTAAKALGVSTRFVNTLLDDPALKHEIEAIMNRTERNATKFLDIMWNWLEDATPDDKAANERKVAAARILARGYISEKAEKPESKPFVIEGLDGGLSNLTGEKKEKVQ